MTTLDVTCHPAPEAGYMARSTASDIRFYSSGAVPGMVSVVLYAGVLGYRAGTRLTFEQARDLRDGLTEHLDAYAPRFTVTADGETTDKEAGA